MKRRSVYVETSIISYLAARKSPNLLAAAWQQVTSEFWEFHRDRYDLYTSEIVVAEAGDGELHASERRLELLRGIPELPVRGEAKALADTILAEGAMPRKAEVDALHVAVAAVNGIEILLTWNCRHLDNPTTKPKVREVCARVGYGCPEICTPLELMEAQPDEG